jgi:phosphonate transport system permease protein
MPVLSDLLLAAGPERGRQAIASFEAERSTYRRRWYLFFSIGFSLFLVLFVCSVLIADFSFIRLFDGFPRMLAFLQRTLPHLDWSNLAGPTTQDGTLGYWFYDWAKWLGLLWESIEMALLATALGATAAFFLSFVAARNLGAVRWLSVLTRRMLELFRTLPDIIVALVFVQAFGPGAAAGVLAIALHTTGALGKLMSEVHENIDMKPIEGVTASGGNWFHAIRFGAMPQILPNFFSYALLRLEINIAAASAVGYVGAGGIGQELVIAIENLRFDDALAIIAMVIALIVVIDLTSEAIRQRFIGASK